MIESRTKDMMILAAQARSSVSFCLVMFVACCSPHTAPAATVVEVGTVAADGEAVAVDVVVSSDAARATGAGEVTGAAGAMPDVAGATLI